MNATLLLLTKADRKLDTITNSGSKVKKENKLDASKYKYDTVSRATQVLLCVDEVLTYGLYALL